jgi:hypothetical protein
VKSLGCRWWVPTNHALRLQGVGVYVIDEGKIVDSRIFFDLGQFRASRS